MNPDLPRNVDSAFELTIEALADLRAAYLKKGADAFTHGETEIITDVLAEVTAIERLIGDVSSLQEKWHQDSKPKNQPPGPVAPTKAPPTVLIPRQAAHRFRDDGAHPFRSIVAQCSD